MARSGTKSPQHCISGPAKSAGQAPNDPETLISGEGKLVSEQNAINFLIGHGTRWEVPRTQQSLNKALAWQPTFAKLKWCLPRIF